MTSAKDICLATSLVVVILTWATIWVISIRSTAWVVYYQIDNGKDWQALFQNQYDVLDTEQLRYDWNSNYYTDIMTVDDDKSCPRTHPETLIYDLWPGTVASCDCTNWSSDEKKFFPNQICMRGENAEH